MVGLLRSELNLISYVILIFFKFRVEINSILSIYGEYEKKRRKKKDKGRNERRNINKQQNKTTTKQKEQNTNNIHRKTHNTLQNLHVRRT